MRWASRGTRVHTVRTGSKKQTMLHTMLQTMLHAWHGMNDVTNKRIVCVSVML